MKTPVLGLGPALVAAGLIGVVGYADHDEDERVEELMEKTHEGRRSPYRQLRAQVEAPAPSWQIVEAALPRFSAMSQALLESKNPDIKGSADGYVDAVTEITAAAKQRDAKALREGFQSLSQSCGDCHFKGGVGGELDD
jgi:mono/diheme cytochrome c family protein